MLKYFDMKLILKYFLIVIVGVGSIGVWWPAIIEAIDKGCVDPHSLPPNLTTYFVAILFTGSVDFFFSMIRRDNIQGLENSFLSIVFIILTTFAAVTVETFLQLRKQDGWACLVAFVGIILSWIMWWVANKNNVNLLEKINPSNAAPNGNDLGGESGGYNV